jgi:hypothetical protein
MLQTLGLWPQMPRKGDYAGARSERDAPRDVAATYSLFGALALLGLASIAYGTVCISRDGSKRANAAAISLIAIWFSSLAWWVHHYLRATLQ